jgi:hypothetical protein
MEVSGQRHALAALYHQEWALGTQWIGSWAGLRAGLDTEARGKILCLCHVQSVVRHYTDWATPTPEVQGMRKDGVQIQDDWRWFGFYLRQSLIKSRVFELHWRVPNTSFVKQALRVSLLFREKRSMNFVLLCILKTLALTKRCFLVCGE